MRSSIPARPLPPTLLVVVASALLAPTAPAAARMGAESGPLRVEDLFELETVGDGTFRMRATLEWFRRHARTTS